MKKKIFLRKNIFPEFLRVVLLLLMQIPFFPTSAPLLLYRIKLAQRLLFTSGKRIYLLQLITRFSFLKRGGKKWATS